MIKFIVSIPARLGSSRLPGKPLRLIAGEPMIVHVARRALESGAESVVVATDDARIADVAATVGAQVCMTASELPSGTDRLAACADACGWPDDRIVVNLQGDEPLAPPEGIRAAAECLAVSGLEMATLAVPLHDAQELFDPHCVKVVRDAAGRALYFSRAPIPWDRDRFAQDRLHLSGQGGWLRHIGIYAYRAGFLRRFWTLPAGRLEQLEKLEQLRALEAGIPIAVGISPLPFPAGVDTEADLARVEMALQHSDN